MLSTTTDHAQPAAHDEPLSLGIAPGRTGLPRLVLRHLVDSRYASIAAGSRSWAQRSVLDIHSVAGGGYGGPLSDTEHVLGLLHTHGLVDAIEREPGATTWVATAAGAVAIERRS